MAMTETRLLELVEPVQRIVADLVLAGGANSRRRRPRSFLFGLARTGRAASRLRLLLGHGLGLRRLRPNALALLFALGAGQLRVHFLLNAHEPGSQLGLRLAGVGFDAGALGAFDRHLRLMLRIHLPGADAADEDQHGRYARHRLHRRMLGALLNLQTHALFLQTHFAFHAMAPLGLLQPKHLLALASFLLGLDATDLCFGLAPTALLFLADRPLGGFLRGALGVGLGAALFVFLADPIVLDPAQLLERKQDRILTTLVHEHLSTRSLEAICARISTLLGNTKCPSLQRAAGATIA